MERNHQSKSLLHDNNENSTVGMISSAGGIVSVMYRIGWQIVGQGPRFARFLQCLADIVPLAVDRRIDLVSHFPVALILFEPNIVGARPRPDRLTVPGAGRFPYPKMMATSNDRISFSLLIAVILLAPEKIQLAHRHL